MESPEKTIDAVSKPVAAKIYPSIPLSYKTNAIRADL